jgi:Na+/melibiose symporter-like transporter
MSAPTTSPAAVALPLHTRALYASSSLGGEALSQSRGLWLLYYYAPPEDAELESLLPLGVAGAVLFAARLVESLDDALIGYWSDRTRSRLGRRIPFVLAGTPFWALFAFLLFTPPTAAGDAATAAYLFIVLECFFLAGTVSGGPYEALFPEIARTSADRVSVVGLRVYFGASGGAVGLVGAGLLVDTAGFQAMALAMAVLALVSRYVGLGASGGARAERSPRPRWPSGRRCGSRSPTLPSWRSYRPSCSSRSGSRCSSACRPSTWKRSSA